jgi:hypothetical protein
VRDDERMLERLAFALQPEPSEPSKAELRSFRHKLDALLVHPKRHRATSVLPALSMPSGVVAMPPAVFSTKSLTSPAKPATIASIALGARLKKTSHASDGGVPSPS